jgi:hypothetical protein
VQSLLAASVVTAILTALDLPLAAASFLGFVFGLAIALLVAWAFAARRARFQAITFVSGSARPRAQRPHPSRTHRSP